MTSEALQPAPKRYRVGSRGSVHELRADGRLVARCGVVLMGRVEATDEPLTCRTCAGMRAVRSPDRRSPPPTSPRRTRADLRLSEVAMYQCEQVNEAAARLYQGDTPTRQRECPPPSIYPPPGDFVALTITRLQQRYERRVNRAALRNTVTAHEELLRLQGYLLPGGPGE